MLLSAVSVLVVARSSSEIPEGLMNNPVLLQKQVCMNDRDGKRICAFCLFKILSMSAVAQYVGIKRL